MNIDYFVELSNFFRAARKKRKLTLADVSKNTGLSTGYLSDLENKLEERLGVPRKVTLLKLLNLYNLNKMEEKEYSKILLNLLIDYYNDEIRAKKIKEIFNIPK